jgi:hypothetical protein
MPVFLCAVATDGKAPSAYALVEQNGDGPERTYAVRELGRFGDRDPVAHLQDLLAASKQYVGRVSVITMGGQPLADRFHEGGLSAVAVQTEAPASRDADTLIVPEQQLVDTFAALYRDNAVDIPGSLDGASEALAAVYAAMGEDAGADEATEEEEALVASEASGEDVKAPAQDGPKPAVVEQSGGSAAVSTAQIGNTAGGHRSTKDAPFLVTDELGPQRQGRTEGGSQTFGPVELGNHRGEALALGLAVWYGEYSTTDLPMTDQADETGRARAIRQARQAAARQAAGPSR